MEILDSASQGECLASTQAVCNRCQMNQPIANGRSWIRHCGTDHMAKVFFDFCMDGGMIYQRLQNFRRARSRRTGLEENP